MSITYSDSTSFTKAHGMGIVPISGIPPEHWDELIGAMNAAYRKIDAEVPWIPDGWLSAVTQANGQTLSDMANARALIVPATYPVASFLMANSFMADPKRQLLWSQFATRLNALRTTVLSSWVADEKKADAIAQSNAWWANFRYQIAAVVSAPARAAAEVVQAGARAVNSGVGAFLTSNVFLLVVVAVAGYVVVKRATREKQ